MKIYKKIEDFPLDLKSVVTIGTFDGLHKGHSSIIDQLIFVSKKNNLQSTVLTFHPHPRNILFLDKEKLKLLNTLEERIELFKLSGIDNLIIHEFTKEFSRMQSVHFIRDILVNRLNMKYLIVGHDHHFGRNRQGSFAELQQFSDLYSFKLKEISARTSEETIISSTKIRKALDQGDIEKANNFLNYSYQFTGKVIHGDKIGRIIGYPTVNLELDDSKLIPKCGVYAVKVEYNQLLYFGMLNIGCLNSKIEVHIFNFDEEIYDSKITVFLLKRIRDEKKMKNLDALKIQLKKDETNCKNFFNLLR